MHGRTLRLVAVGLFTVRSHARSSDRSCAFVACGSVSCLFNSNELHRISIHKSSRRQGQDAKKVGASIDNVQETNAVGLYRKFLDHASEKIEESGLFRPAEIPFELNWNEAPAARTKDSIVRMTNKAMIPSEGFESLVRYARVALLETVSMSSEDTVQSTGIQVLNFVIIPSDSTSLPVLGIDLVSLPGNKHLLLLDAQPMIDPNPFENKWTGWHKQHVDGQSHFPWGGDFPEPVQQYISKHALWTRLQEQEDPISIIQNQVWNAFVSHLDIYMGLLEECNDNLESVQGRNHQPTYLDYRRNNDPAKPMLKALYGAAWTERVLEEVLFPQVQL